MSRTISAPGSRACAAQLAFPAAIFPTGIARSTTCGRELIGFQSMVCGGGCRERGSIGTPETRLGERAVGMSGLPAISEIPVLFRPGRRERGGDTLVRGIGG